jgi:hypothetical protein
MIARRELVCLSFGCSIMMLAPAGMTKIFMERNYWYETTAKNRGRSSCYEGGSGAFDEAAEFTW